MMTHKFMQALEKYHLRKWFPDLYPDASQEFSDFASEESIRNLMKDWQERNDLSAYGAASYLQDILPVLRFPDLHAEFRRAFDDRFSFDIGPRDAFYYIRSLPIEESKSIWSEFRAWCDEWESVLHDWMHTTISLSALVPPLSSAAKFEKRFHETRDLFFWQLRNEAPAANSLEQMLRVFRWEHLDTIADWNDFRALEKSIAEIEGIKRRPKLDQSAEKAIEQVFPIDPPHRVRLQHGRAVGFVDAVRFLTELGRAFFYSGMDPDLAIEKRISGDPAVPHFWGYIHALIFADPNCLPQLIGPVGESAAEQTKIFLEFWFRYDVCLSVYRNSVRERFEQVRDLYASNFELAFPFSTPHFLYLYDLIRSNGATARAAGFFSANAALERLREMYGKRWFANSHFSQRMRDYWWSGFSLTLDQILNDWGIPV